MKKEFKTPEIEICTLNTSEIMLASGETSSTGILGTGGNALTKNVFSVDSTSTSSSVWQDWI